MNQVNKNSSGVLAEAKGIIMIMRDTGMRNVRELYRLRVENIYWDNRVIFNPNSKAKKQKIHSHE
jgi:integrase